MTEEIVTEMDWEEFDQIRFLFYHVRDFVERKFPKLKKVALNPLCQEIRQYRDRHARDLKGRRAMMHVAHHPNIVCLWIPAARGLSTNHLIGLYLHEFGHIGSKGGDDQADRWVEKNFGIKIHYRGELELEWVSREDGMKVLA